MNDNDRERINKANSELAKSCKPEKVFEFFAQLSAIPRESGHVAAVADFLMQFAEDRKDRGFEKYRDATGNVYIRKPAQKHQGNRGVILQAHQDMVCVKTEGTDHDFRRDPIEFVMGEDGWLRANHTTLGGDDGIGVAIALAVLDSTDIPHPPLEGLFTVDEETDMKGAENAEVDHLQGSVLINLDAEDLNIAYISSAAGVTGTVTLPMPAATQEAARPIGLEVTVSGLNGGHSGVEIHKARANAYVLLARFLAAADMRQIDYAMHTFGHGTDRVADNVIPKTAKATLSLKSQKDADDFNGLAEELAKTFRNEYRSADPEVAISVKALAASPASPIMDASAKTALLSVIRLLPLGVFRFIQTDDLLKTAYGDLLVETSCNMGTVKAENGKATLSLFARGSTESVLDDLMARVAALAELAGGAYKEDHKTKGWEMPKEHTPVQKRFEEQGLKCIGVHAGLECGCLVGKFKDAGRRLDAISVGPDLKDVHSDKERLHVGSVAVLWDQLLAVLKQL